MAVQAGKDLLIKVDMTSDGQFETIAGLRATRVSFNAEPVEVTSLDSDGGWRELLAGAGPFQVASIDYGGALNGEATYELSLQSAGQLNFTPDIAEPVV